MRTGVCIAKKIKICTRNVCQEINFIENIYIFKDVNVHMHVCSCMWISPNCIRFGKFMFQYLCKFLYIFVSNTHTHTCTHAHNLSMYLRMYPHVCTMRLQIGNSFSSIASDRISSHLLIWSLSSTCVMANWWSFVCTHIPIQEFGGYFFALLFLLCFHLFIFGLSFQSPSMNWQNAWDKCFFVFVFIFISDDPFC